MACAIAPRGRDRISSDSDEIFANEPSFLGHGDKNSNLESIEIQELFGADKGERATPTIEWHPGFKSRFPWLGISSIFGVFVCAVLALLVLLLSDGVAQEDWPHGHINMRRLHRSLPVELPEPSVLLAMINAGANIALLVAATQGFAIQWWRKGLRGATIEELHRDWSFSTSVIDVAMGIRHWNFIAFAAIATKLCVLDGILLQKATSTWITDDSFSRNITMQVLQLTDIPTTAASLDGTPDIYTDTFLTAQGFALGVLPVDLNGGYLIGCNGVCEGSTVVAGFVYECETSQANANFSKATNHSNPALSVNFEMDWAREGKPYSSIQYDWLAYENGVLTDVPGSGCVGIVYRGSCQLRPALLDAQFSVSYYDGADASNAGGIQPTGVNYVAPDNQAAGWFFSSYLNYYEDGSSGQSRIWGIQQYLQQYLGSKAAIAYTDGSWNLDSEGFYALFSANQVNEFNPTCPWSFQDPTIDMMGRLNTLMVDLAVSIGQDYRNVSAIQTGHGIHYKTNKGYLIAAELSMFFCALLVLPSFYGYWQLGRKVTLGPFEVANALGAPMLDHPVGASGGLDALLAKIGMRRLVYGKASPNSSRAGRLVLADPDVVKSLKLP